MPHEGERFSEIAESKRALDAMGVIAQLPIRSLRLQAQRLIARQRRDPAATRRAGLLSQGVGHILSPSHRARQCWVSAIDLAEYDIKRADDRRDVGEHVPPPRARQPSLDQRAASRHGLPYRSVLQTKRD